VHTLTLTAINPSPTRCNFTIDTSDVYVGCQVGFVTTVAAGRIEVTEINNVTAPYTVTFLRDDSFTFILEVGQTQTW